MNYFIEFKIQYNLYFYNQNIQGRLMRIVGLKLTLMMCMLLTSTSGESSDFKTSPNSFSGINQFKQNISLSNYDSLKVIGAHVGIESRIEKALSPAIKRRAEKFEENVVEQFSAALQTESNLILSSAFSLPVVAEHTATTLVVRPSILDFEIGLSGRKLLSNPDNIVINIEVFNAVDGGLTAMVSANLSIRRERLFNSNGMRTSKAKSEAERIAETLGKMLKAMFVDIEK